MRYRWCECRYVGEGIAFVGDVLCELRRKRKPFGGVKRGQ